MGVYRQNKHNVGRWLGTHTTHIFIKTILVRVHNWLSDNCACAPGFKSINIPYYLVESILRC